MAVIGVNYTEFSKKKDMGYQSVDISYNNLKKEKIFDSGDFVKDWYNCNKFIITKLFDKEPHIMMSSSFDNFFMDGAKFDSAYLITNGDEAPELSYERDDDKIEFFVKKGTKPTWLELRELCGDPKK